MFCDYFQKFFWRKKLFIFRRHSQPFLSTWFYVHFCTFYEYDVCVLSPMSWGLQGPLDPDRHILGTIQKTGPTYSWQIEKRHFFCNFLRLTITSVGSENFYIFYTAGTHVSSLYPGGWYFCHFLLDLKRTTFKLPFLLCTVLGDIFLHSEFYTH